jgi:hypothetical protein
MAAKTFAAWSQKAKQKGINSSRAAYQGYLNNIGASEPNAPAKSRAATTLQRKSAATSSSSEEKKSAPKIYTAAGEEYNPTVSGNFFGSNPNKGYKGEGQISGGKVMGYDTDSRETKNIYMTKNGKRAFATQLGTFYETSPGSNEFKSTIGGEMSGSYYTITDTGQTKAEEAAAAEEESSGGSSGSGSSGSSGQSSTQSAMEAAKTEVDLAIENVQTASSAAQSEITDTANTFPGAPAWVKTQDDYDNWLRSQSAAQGFAGTQATSSTGLTEDQYSSNVYTTSLSG